MLLLGDTFPNFTAETTEGSIDFHKWMDQSWCILFSHPSDFTPVCTTELARVITLMPEFQKRNVKVIGISCDTISSHIEWCKDIQHYAQSSRQFPYPIIEDAERKLAHKLGMIDKDELEIHIQTRYLEEVGHKQETLSGEPTFFPVNIFGMFDEAKNIFSNVVSKILDKRKVIGLKV